MKQLQKLIKMAISVKSMNKKRLVDLFCQIVQIDSPSGYEKDMANWVFQKLRSFKLSPKFEDFGNIIVKIPGD